VGTCSTTNTKDDIVQVGKLCDCLAPLQAKLDAGNFTTCPFFEAVAGALSLQFQTNRCSVNKGTNAVCDNKAIDACSKGLSMCQSNILGGVSLWCPCWASYGKCIEQNKNCQAAAIFQNGFYELCRTNCPATTDCGQPGVTLSFRTFTDAPEFLTDASGAFVTGPGGVRVTVAPTVAPTESENAFDGFELTDDLKDCSVTAAIGAAFCIGNCDSDGSTAQDCACHQKVFDCVKEKGCKVQALNAMQKDPQAMPWLEGVQRDYHRRLGRLADPRQHRHHRPRCDADGAVIHESMKVLNRTKDLEKAQNDIVVFSQG
jgi:hypothetical protein